ncbi:MAG: transketolase [Planctomycetes bacterium]|nr:transketolase [Planctomycetota bacterium]
MSTIAESVEQTAINTIRTLAMDAVEAATCGHPGTPMALAPVAYQLWTQHLRYDPAAPLWLNRDRYVLSCGHASMLIYSLIHLAGIRDVDVAAGGSPAVSFAGEPPASTNPSLSLDELRNFRQWGSRTPGHPELKHTAGIETTTGPLGQGCGNSVGMAIAGRWLAARYNRPGFELFNFNVWTQCSDGDLMEGVANEAASLAGHLKLSNLCWIYDDNHITIEGSTDLAFSEDVATRFRGLGWHVLAVHDANDLAAIDKAYRGFLSHDGSPTLIVVKSIIGYGAPTKANTAKAHGEALGAEEIAKAKASYGWPTDAKFLVPPEVPKHFQETLGKRGAQLHRDWVKLFNDYEKKYPELARELRQIQKKELPDGWDKDVPSFPADAKGMATRVSSGKVLNAIAKRVPWLLGGSADLAPSTKTLLTFEEAGGDLSADNPGGRNMHFGVREHGMVASVNGMVICGLRAYGATFFVFSDYCRPALRLAAIMKIPTIVVFTHDSIGLGEDGPTHQPVEHLAACRAIPRLLVLRPADANETAEVWRIAMQQTERPVALVLTRQDLPTFDRTKYAPASNVARGGYVLADSCSQVSPKLDSSSFGETALRDSQPDVILMATGSEVRIAVAAHEKLSADGIRSRVVSLPSFELFDEQPVAYRDEVLPPNVTARVAVEAGVRQCWDKYLGRQGAFIGLDTYGASAPYQEIYRHRGLTPEAVIAAARQQLDR